MVRCADLIALGPFLGCDGVVVETACRAEEGTRDGTLRFVSRKRHVWSFLNERATLDEMSSLVSGDFLIAFLGPRGRSRGCVRA